MRDARALPPAPGRRAVRVRRRARRCRRQVRLVERDLHEDREGLQVRSEDGWRVKAAEAMALQMPYERGVVLFAREVTWTGTAVQGACSLRMTCRQECR